MESVADALPIMSFRVTFSPELNASFEYVSPHSHVVTGYSPAEILADPALLLERFHPEDMAAWSDCVSAVRAKRSDCHFEARYRHKDGHYVDIRAEARCQHAPDGSFRAVGCWFDISDQVRAESALKIREQRLQAILDHSPALIHLKDLEGRYVTVNRAYEQCMGKTLEQIRGRTAEELFPPRVAREIMANDRDVIRRGEALEFEEDVHGERGHRKYLTQKFPLRDPRGAIEGTAGISTDFTVREEMRSRLSESEERYRALVENSLIGVIVVRDNKILFANQAEAGMFGFDSPAEMVGLGMNDRIAPEDLDRLMGYRIARQRGEAVPQRYEFTGIRRDGGRFRVESFAAYVPWADGRAISALHVDITARAQAEEALRASEARYRLLMENSLQGAVITDGDSKVMFANQAAAELLGFQSSEELIGRKVDDVLDPEERDDFRGRREARMAGDVPPRRAECRVRNARGEWVWVSFVATTVDWEGQRAVQSTFMDITERKRSELRVRNLIEVSPLALVVHRDFKVLFANDAAASLFGYSSRDAMLARDYAGTFVPGDLARIRKRNAEQLAGRKVETHLEREAVRADGSRLWLDTLVALIDWDGEKAFLIALVDITARKRAEEARWRSEALLKGFMDHAPAIITVRDKDGRFEMVNRQFLHRMQLSAEQVIGKTVREVFPPHVADEIEPHARQVLTTGQPQIFEEVAERPDGSRSNLASRFPLFDRNGQISGVGSITLDITALKQAELALRESEGRYRAVMENSLQGIMVSYGERIVFANDALAGIFGYGSAEEMIGLDPIVLYAPVTHAEFEVRKRKLLAGEPVQGGEREGRRRDGGTVWVHGQPVGIQWAGQPAVLVSYVDITERKVAQEAVERGRRILFTMMNALPSPIYLKDREGRYMLVNEAMCRDHGLTKDQILGRTVAELEFGSPERAGEIMTADRRVIEEGIPIVIPEIKVPLRTGKVQWQHHVKVPYRNDAGEVVGVVGLLMDITGRKTVEEALRESREHLATVLDLAPDALITTDRVGTIRTFNRAAERIFGWTRDEAIGKNARILVPPEDGERYAMLVERYLRTGVPTVRDIGADPRAVRKDGSTFPVMLRVGEVRREGEINFTLIVADITQRKRAEEALRASRTYLTAVLDFAPEAILTIDEFYRIETANRRVEQMFGYDREELIGRDVFMLAPEEHRGRYMARVNAHLADSAVNLNARHEDGFEPEGRRKDGSTFPISFRAGSVKRGDQTTFTVMISDATRQREHEARLREMARTKSAMLSSLTHELRTPITAILGFAQLLRSEKNLTETQREDLRVIEQSTHHLLELVNDVLDAQKIEAGVVTLNHEPFDLYRAMDMLMGMFRPRCEAKGIGAQLEIERGVPKYALGDERKLRQVLINLVGNAIKFTDQGGIAIKLSSRDGRVVRFTVEDTGVGIHPEDLARIGKPFEQGHSERGGTGLGLTISKGLIELMGGTLSYESKYGAGSAFSFDLPIADTEYN